MRVTHRKRAIENQTQQANRCHCWDLSRSSCGRKKRKLQVLEKTAAATRRHYDANVSLSKDEEKLICLKNPRELQLLSQKVVNYSKLQTS